MNRTDRLVAMVMYLQGRRVVKAEELARHFEVNIRTIYRDVAALGEAGVPVAGEAGVGYSLVRGYHLPPVMFTAEEAIALFIGGEMVKQFADASLTGPMDSAVLKIRSVLPRERQDDLERLTRATAIFGSPRLSTGIDQRTLLPIEQAIVSSRVLRMTYRGRARAEETRRDVEPLGVTYHDGVWYLVAWCRLRKDLRYFRLDRVRALEVLGERFAPRPDFSLRRFLEQNMDDRERVAAKIWFAEDALDRVRRESYNGVVALRPEGAGAEVELKTFSLEWLARWILSFGAEAEARSPAKLRALVRQEAEAVAQRYGDA
ncbi:helix-turn-helix transcriptional regulator [Opitutus terrae]|uniref:Helix-turn-helix type 11 domain protein n=1 Tax=Opitutus terrae (strain DSM 11246 / JCM 15787 / PB90-1) TaxID=452637 RepID=B2A042_OPITP|nr:YafY family protein [Opitutus terrae]ACB77378.1 Helix-turn-helix type 11 domain protein [Opitutus terrae PB90-1]